MKGMLHRAWGALKSVLDIIVLVINAKKYMSICWSKCANCVARSSGMGYEKY